VPCDVPVHTWHHHKISRYSSTLSEEDEELEVAQPPIEIQLSPIMDVLTEEEKRGVLEYARKVHRAGALRRYEAAKAKALTQPEAAESPVPSPPRPITSYFPPLMFTDFKTFFRNFFPQHEVMVEEMSAFMRYLVARVGADSHLYKQNEWSVDESARYVSLRNTVRELVDPVVSDDSGYETEGNYGPVEFTEEEETKAQEKNEKKRRITPQNLSSSSTDPNPPVVGHQMVMHEFNVLEDPHLNATPEELREWCPGVQVFWEDSTTDLERFGLWCGAHLRMTIPPIPFFQLPPPPDAMQLPQQHAQALMDAVMKSYEDLKHNMEIWGSTAQSARWIFTLTHQDWLDLGRIANGRPNMLLHWFQARPPLNLCAHSLALLAGELVGRKGCICWCKFCAKQYKEHGDSAPPEIVLQTAPADWPTLTPHQLQAHLRDLEFKKQEKAQAAQQAAQAAQAAQPAQEAPADQEVLAVQEGDAEHAIPVPESPSQEE
jgi:hypothetical protein